jgi:hypothetical protein
MNIYILILIIIIISIIYILNKYYTTFRYNYMVRERIFKNYLKQHNVYITSNLNKLAYYIDQLIVFFDTNIILRELINNNRIPLKFVLFFKYILEFLNKLITFIIKFLNK